MSGLTKETPLADSFLKLYRETTTHSADRALIILIDQNKEAIEPLFDARDPFWMHKAFRQTDVCGSGNTDMLIWHLIHASQDFFDTLHFFWNKKLDRRDERRKGVLLAECERERDALLSEMRASPDDYPNLLRINREHAEYCDEQLAALQAKYDELVMILKWVDKYVSCAISPEIKTALAKLGANKTGEV